LKIVEFRVIPKEQAKKEIIGFIKGKERVWADELADALRLDLTFALCTIHFSLSAQNSTEFLADTPT